MRYFCTILLSAAVAGAQAQTTHLISVFNDFFEPDTLEILAGDSIHLVFEEPIHTFTQVDDTTWLANGETPNGGFDYGFGTANPGTDFTFSLDTSGTYYYVCVFHVFDMGMKGLINASIVDDLEDRTNLNKITLFPNPANDLLSIELPEGGDATVTLTDLQGRAIGPRHRTSSDMTTLRLDGLSPGFYCVVIETEGRRIGLPVAKE